MQKNIKKRHEKNNQIINKDQCKQLAEIRDTYAMFKYAEILYNKKNLEESVKYKKQH